MEKYRLANKDFGDWGEQIAVDYLISNNIKVIGRNIRTRYGEIDILGQKDGIIIFFEVKTRRTEEFGNPEDAVDYKKREHMKNSALDYMQSNLDLEMDWRIDVIAIFVGENNKLQIRWVKNALTD